MLFRSVQGGKTRCHVRLYEAKAQSETITAGIIGTISSLGWWFDDVEAIQAQCLNLDSLHKDSLARAVYPQSVLPLSVLNNAETKLREVDSKSGGETIQTLALEILKSMEQPLFESDDSSNISRYLQPNYADMKVIPDELMRTRSLLFDTAWLALFNKEGRQIQTAESKQFDHLDTSSTLQNRALILQEAEEKLVALSVHFDDSFGEYAPQWPQDFDVSDNEANMKAVMMVGNLPDATPAMRRMAMLAAVHVLQGVCKFDDELVEMANEEIEEIGEVDFDRPAKDVAQNFPRRKSTG